MTADRKERFWLNCAAFCCLGLYAIFCVITFYSAMEPSLRGASEWRVYADADVYMEQARVIQHPVAISDLLDLVAPGQNLIAPVCVVLLATTPAMVAVINAGIFLLSCAILGFTFPHFRWYIFLPLAVLSGTGYQSLLQANKEIFVLLSAVLLARWFVKPSNWLMLLILCLSFVVRWEEAFVLLVFLGLRWFHIRLRTALILLIAGISVCYPFAHNAALDMFDTSTDAYQTINTLQMNGLFFLLVIPKLIISMTSQFLRPWQLADPHRLHDLTTGLFVALDQLFLCIVAVWTWRKKLWKTCNPLIYFVAVCSVVYIAVPQNSPRYLYLPYLLLAIMLSVPELQKRRITGRLIVAAQSLPTSLPQLSHRPPT